MVTYRSCDNYQGPLLAEGVSIWRNFKGDLQCDGMQMTQVLQGFMDVKIGINLMYNTCFI